jgi:hypothetical protein
MSQRNYANAFRHADGSDGFDFWNVRVVLPEAGLFFYAMPFILSAPGTPGVRGGLWVYDGGNGSPGGVSAAAVEYVGSEGWSAAGDGCDVRWSRQGEVCCFAERRILMVGPSGRWDVTITPYLEDEERFANDAKQTDLIERVMLRRVPFIHRVPRMKGYATGRIQQQGREHSFERALVYQAKNHGRAFPLAWTWIYSNAFREDEDIAFEAGWLETTRTAPGVGMVRIARPSGTSVLGTWLGDRVEVTQEADSYTFRASAKDGSVSIEGSARHGENVRFSFRGPDGGDFENDECLVGALTAEIGGRRLTSSMAALGRGRRVRAPLDGLSMGVSQRRRTKEQAYEPT